MDAADDPPRWRELIRKDIDGTITEAESAALRRHCDAYAQRTFEACPICSGAFSLFEVRTPPFRCSHCGTELQSCSGERLPHHPHEVDPAIPDEPMLGEFAVWYYPTGCTPCACGVNGTGYFPAAYSCCPSLLVLAAEMSAGGNDRAYPFLGDHSDTLMAALRADTFSVFNIEHLSRFIHDPRHPACGPAIVAVLSKRSGDTTASL